MALPATTDPAGSGNAVETGTNGVVLVDVLDMSAASREAWIKIVAPSVIPPETVTVGADTSGVPSTSTVCIGTEGD